MPFENPQADAAPTRRSSRLRTEAVEAPAAGPTESVAAVETVLAFAAVAPLSRRAARQRQTDVAPVVNAPLVPFAVTTAEAAAPAPAEAPAAPRAAGTDTASANADDDAFERASRAFRTTGPVPTASARPASNTETDREEKPETSSHVAARRPRSMRKVLTVGATVGVMSLAGLLAVSMTLPAEAVAAVQGSPIAATSLVSASAASSEAAKDEIQAFVAPSGVQNESLARADDFSTVSLVEVAAEQGIRYSSEIYTNDPEAAIQWPYLVGVGMSYGYGMRSGRLHEGIDFVPGNGAPVQAIADGTVRIATEQGGAYGVTVYIDHVIDGSVITSHYSHMQYGSLQVTQGQTVKVGDVIGKTGNTGRSYGAHLHFELIVNGSTIDPLPWLNANAGRYSY
ncbi:M23 family metallopeptidase [Microbacterium sp. SA39]|uniref:M23 family metallopeptidase n=1 Tax=Microbacterium sp. SA39 TaxID=1263625 RepID=UPI0005F9D6E2|nr:M23 family metallopeptidase [Microbacterium sp. SA39]KJQ55127.1 Murein DD-endopeptidase MepM [Microbacterium sp. SA39]